MRSAKALLALVGIGLLGCSNATAASHSAGPAPAGHATAEPSAARAKPAQARTEAGARAAAARFYRLYSGRQFAASWDLLAPAAKRQVAKRVWIGVHGGCLAAIGAGGRVIRSVTVFGDAAIVTHQLTGAHARHRIARDIFNYRWPLGLLAGRPERLPARVNRGRHLGCEGSRPVFRSEERNAMTCAITKRSR
jgi:hypothetical protein